MLVINIIFNSIPEARPRRVIPIEPFLRVCVITIEAVCNLIQVQCFKTEATEYCCQSNVIYVNFVTHGTLPIMGSLSSRFGIMRTQNDDTKIIAHLLLVMSGVTTLVTHKPYILTLCA